MRNRITKFKVLIVLFLVLALFCQEAYAWGGGGGRYYYRGNRWYRHGLLGFDIAVAALTIGALVYSLPPRYTTVVIGGVPYYYYDNIYYRPCPGGYVVVPAPVMTQTIMVEPVPVVQQVVVGQSPAIQPVSQAQEVSTINIPNARGGYTAVTLRRSGRGFIGPQGEYYSEHPTVEQLRVLYGQ